SSVFPQISLRKGDHDCLTPSMKDKPLLSAIGKGDSRAVKRLLRNGADPNARDGCRVSAVTYAAANLKPDILKELLSSGADVNIIDDFYREPPLLWALEHKEADDTERIYEVSRLLVLAGADVNLKGTSTQTALIIAVTKGLDRVADLLVSNGAQINAKDD